ncbi:hypothetical protein MLD38_020267 [Melastoma candidum]|uniref:Uncharacterized protein n=1 Tax=Melastoma candidum TaxID=119954 RepID=A0ACB9QCJ6_9MYRT|nr:hypothetical protein MLD38_020267 [Melastoma candidum]
MSPGPDHFRKAKIGVTPSPSPFLTPRPEKRRPDFRGPEWNSSRQDRRDSRGEVNVQVLLRCRPFSDDEQRMNASSVISCNEQRREVTVTQNPINKQTDRVFTFDKVFGPKAQQRSIYDQAVAPIVEQVLDGFNCTVFAYGQTGTGKTYTMEGGMNSKSSELTAETGVIPRAVRQIFDTLEAQNADYSMKVTFLELYNEEVTDLLASEDVVRFAEERQKRPISLMEDGKGCVFVRGLEEVAVYSANEIYTLLEQGAAKRRTADTLLNKRSSRSHSVFSIMVYIKETTIGDEELIKCGKLCLVDLAGSENISRSGSRDGRAKEAGEINKSLLTLGRVINALVEHSPHVPYRDSKLTRILRDSLGGKTKTCIIATISPSAHCLEETLSTLDYAYRAKNIKNKPEANQKISKALLLKDFYAEMERMREDVRAAREKNGIYIPHDRFAQEETEKKARNERIEELESKLSQSKKQAENFRKLYLNEQGDKQELEGRLNNCKSDLESTRRELHSLQEQYTLAVTELKEKEFKISKYQQSENALIEYAKDLRSDLKDASEDLSSLFMRLEEKNRMEADNHNTVLTFGSNLDQSLKALHRTMLGLVSQQQQQIRCMEENACSFLAHKHDATRVLQSKINKMTESHKLGISALVDLAQNMQMAASSGLHQMSSVIASKTVAVQNHIHKLAVAAKEVISDIQNSLLEQQEILAFSAQQQEEGLQRALISGRLISNATLGFLIDLNDHASVMKRTVDENLLEKSNHLQSFEKLFKEEAAREEKLAMEKVAAILANLTSKKDKMVSEACKSMIEKITYESQQLHRHTSNMQQVSDGAKEELGKYTFEVENNFWEDTFSAVESRTILDSCFNSCLKMLDSSRKQWHDVESVTDTFQRDSTLDVASATQTSISQNIGLCNDFHSKSSLFEEAIKSRAEDLSSDVEDQLRLDRNAKEKGDTAAASFMDHLRSVAENHGETVSEIRSKAEHCLIKEFKVDQNSSNTLKRRSINIPSLSSIEQMRLSLGKEKSRAGSIDHHRIEGKAQSLLESEILGRTPFTDVN